MKLPNITTLWLRRTLFLPDRTFGVLECEKFYDSFWGFPLCTLEDAVRGDGDPKTVSEWKIPGSTAIPFGEYRVKLAMSPKRKIIVPWVENVPGFEAIQIHVGNEPKDTDGCILVGEYRKKPRAPGAKPALLNSHIAFEKLMDFLEGEPDITLKVIDGRQK
jgi:hypothetical protein